MEELYFTPKRVRKSILHIADSCPRRRNLFNAELEDDIVPLSPTSSELYESDVPSSVSPLKKSIVTGVTELGEDSGLIPAKSFYGLKTEAKINDAKSLLESVNNSLPEAYHKIKSKMRLSFEEEPTVRKKRSRSAGAGDSAKRAKKKPKIHHYIPFESSRKKRPPPKPEPKSEPRCIGYKKIRYNWELFSTPSRSFFHNKSSSLLTPPSSGQKAKPKKQDSDEEFIDSEKTKIDQPKTPEKDSAVNNLKELIQDIAHDDDDNDVKEEVENLLLTLDENNENEVTEKGMESPANDKENVDLNIEVATPKKLFSIFTTPKSGISTPQSNIAPSPMTPLSARVRKMGLGDDQLQLDVGQKNLREVHCPECKFFYCKGLPEDEIVHENFHKRIGTFKFKGWKDENVVGLDGADRVILVRGSDSKIKWERAKKVLQYVDEELGFPEGGLAPDSIFLFIKDQEIVGLVACVAVTEAYRVIDLGINDPSVADVCTEESYPVWCGISRMWVNPKNRGKGIATTMLEAVRRNYIFGCVLMKDQIAFSTPTIDGKKFAEHYCQRKDYLVYF